MASDVEETLKRIQSHRGVLGVIIINSDGIPIKTTMDNAQTVQYAALIGQLTDKTRSTVRDLDPTNELTFFRIRSKKHEIMVSGGHHISSFNLKFQQNSPRDISLDVERLSKPSSSSVKESVGYQFMTSRYLHRL